MNIVLWIGASLLAAVFTAAGLVKLAAPREKLADTMSWTIGLDDSQMKGVRLLGAAEVAGAIGLILPGVLDIAPVLVPIAAICLALTMLGAVLVHVKHHETARAAPAIVIGIICVFIAWGRLGPNPF